MLAEKNADEFRALLQEYVYGVAEFSEYLRLCGGMEKMKALRDKELLI
jgi:glutaconate CoA-transferase, subunit A